MDALVTLLGPGPEEEGDRATLLLAVQAVTQQGQRAFQSPNQAPPRMLHGLARVATAIAERDPSVAGSPEVAGLLSIVFFFFLFFLHYHLSLDIFSRALRSP